MHHTRRFVLLPLLLLGSLSACSDAFDEAPPTSTAPVRNLDAQFARAAERHGVPVALLKGIGYTETRWQMVVGEEEFPGVAPAFGIMALRGAALTRGAALAGVTEAAARTDVDANLLAAAALLGAYADEAGIDRDRLEAWGPIAARYSGIEGQDGQAAYVHTGVYAAIQEGIVARTPEGAVIATLAPVAVRPDFPAPEAGLGKTAAVDYPGAVWRPSPNYNSRPTGSTGSIGMVIIHTCEGSYSSCWSWLTNSASGVSAHYVVNEAGTEVSQLVLEANRAWHIGATYDCTLNNNVDCWRNGTSSNHFTIGIEHGGYASQSSFPVAQINLSAKLGCDISKGHNIPRDVYHFVAHGKLQPATRTDPGPNWPWTDYLNKINAECGSGDIIIDSNNSNNNTSVGYLGTVSANWTSSASTAGYYGSGYYFANTAAVSDPATFYFYLSSAQTRTVDAWWTAGSNRSATAPFMAYNASGTHLGTVNANQQANGGKWNQLGTFNFTAGWNKIQLSRWTTSGYVVIADAVRIR